MNLNAGEVLKPVFDFLDNAIADYGVYLFLVLAWVSVLVLVWVFSGGLWSHRFQHPICRCIR